MDPGRTSLVNKGDAGTRESPEDKTDNSNFPTEKCHPDLNLEYRLNKFSNKYFPYKNRSHHKYKCYFSSMSKRSYTHSVYFRKKQENNCNIQRLEFVFAAATTILMLLQAVVLRSRR